MNKCAELVKKFADGSELTRGEISYMQNTRLICTEGKGHQYTLTELGCSFLPDGYDCSRTYSNVLNNGRSAVDSKVAIYNYVHGHPLTDDQRQTLFGLGLIEAAPGGGTETTPAGDKLYKEALAEMLTSPAALVVGSAPTARDNQIGGDHYMKLGAYQPWEVLSHWLTAEELRGYMKGTVIAYLARERDKGGDVDIAKSLHTMQLWEELRPK